MMSVGDKIKWAFFFVVIGALIGLAAYKTTLSGKLALPTQSGGLTINQQSRVVVTEEDAITSAVAKTSPSVIAIAATQTQPVLNPFDPFAAPQQPDSTSNTIGTGFVVSDKGIIVTNRHVVSDPNAKYTVVTRDAKKLDITKIYRDPTLDLAILQVNSTDLKALDLGDSSKLKVGQIAIAIGNALGQFDNTVTTGVVSGLGRSVTAGDGFSGQSEQLDNLIQTDAAINPGNSGGPLLDSSGNVIGVNVATTQGAQNIGFAIPINSVKAIVDEFVQTGTITRPFLGVSYRYISLDVALLQNVPQGAFVENVISGSPADKAGIKAQDIITKIDGQRIDSESKISQITQSKKVGDSVSLEIWTNGTTRTVNATLVNYPNQ